MTNIAKNSTSSTNVLIYPRILLACLIGIIALTFPILIVKHSGILVDKPIYQHLLQSIFTGIVVVFGIWMLRSKMDKGLPESIGLTNSYKAVGQVIFGFGLIAFPLILAILIGLLFGWATLSINIGNGILVTFLIGMIGTLFTDALTEELIFRGYIYSNLRARFNIWISSLITLAAFVVVPIIILFVQKLIGLEWSISLTGGYVVTLIFFGCLVQYLRILTKSIWVGVGFHWFFVHMNQLMGITDDKLIQFAETSNEQAMQLTLIILILLVFSGLILYPIIRKTKLE